MPRAIKLIGVRLVVSQTHHHQKMAATESLFKCMSKCPATHQRTFVKQCSLSHFTALKTPRHAKIAGFRNKFVGFCAPLGGEETDRAAAGPILSAEPTCRKKRPPGPSLPSFSSMRVLAETAARTRANDLARTIDPPYTQADILDMLHCDRSRRHRRIGRSGFG